MALSGRLSVSVALGLALVAAGAALAQTDERTVTYPLIEGQIPLPDLGLVGQGLPAFEPQQAAEQNLELALPRNGALRPYYEFPPIDPRTIIGDDERELVENTKTFPARAIVLIEMPGGRCSGFLYAKNMVATAGHYVHPGRSGAWYQDLRVYPGYNETFAPFGSCGVTRSYSVEGWIIGGSKYFDYAAIQSDCNIGETVGWLGLFWTADTLVGSSTRITGYPGDKDLTMWEHLDQVWVEEERKVFYLNDTTGGMSGSPVYTSHPSYGDAAMAVHTNGLHNDFSAPSFSTHNAGTRITQERLRNLIAWRDYAATFP